MITKDDSMFSVRQVPWHGLGVVLPEAPKDTLDALTKAGLGWGVRQEPVYRKVTLPDPDEDGATFDTYVEILDAEDIRWTVNTRSDTGAVLGIVTEQFKPVQNIEAFRFLDALLGGDVAWETAGSLQGGKRVWVLARVPGHVQLAGDESDLYIFCANAHDGTMSVTAASTMVRIVCANTLGWALSKADYGAGANRTYKFRHTGNLTAKFAEARRVMGMTVSWSKTMKTVADQLGLVQVTDKKALEIIGELSVCKVNEEMTPLQARNRERTAARIMSLFKGEGEDGDTRGNAPGTAWTLVNAIGEHADWGRRYTVRTNQMARSFEDTGLKQEGLELVLSAVN
jgi:phage/plasmid-like protein (TIGR03299 family)